MTAPLPHARALPLAAVPTGPHGNRDITTCIYKCAMACYHPAPNTSPNSYFGDLVQAALSRRSVLAAAGATALALPVALPSAAAAAGRGSAGGGRGRPTAPGALTFTPVPPVPASVDSLEVPRGYAWSVVIGWLDPLSPGAPLLDPADPDPEVQEHLFGYNCDYVGLVELEDGRTALVVNHEYTNEELMYPGWSGAAAATPDQIRTSMAAHGMSVVEVDVRGASGRVGYDRTSELNRRLTATTPFRLSGPVAGDALVRTAADPSGTRVLGTLNNCAGGLTPWRTVLSGEENFNGYFGGVGAGSRPDYSGSSASDQVKAQYARYGVGSTTSSPFWRNWESVDSRFDLREEVNEVHRFGWIVEVDPSDPTSTPVKRTAMGRFKHEGANIRLGSDRRAYAYMGDDERFEYLYRFVSRDAWTSGPAGDLLDHGTLSVARFEAGDGLGGRGQWVPLVTSSDGVATSHVPGMTGVEALVWTREAADAVGATKMDRPEDVEPSPVTGVVYVACTNNDRRTEVNAANPRTTNKHGHVLEVADDAQGTGFSWRFALIAGDPDDESTYFAGFDKDAVSPISCPDNVAFDGAGNLWLATDGNALGYNDGLFAMPVTGPDRGYLRQFATVPTGAECCGPFLTADGRTAFIAVQHPGERRGSTFETPASTFPYDGRAYGVPVRPAVVAIVKQGPGAVGS